VYAMARSAVGNTLGTASHGKTVVAVRVRRNTIGGQVVTQRQAFIAVASPARGHRDAGCVHQRSLLFRPQNQVLPVAIAAHRRTGYAGEADASGRRRPVPVEGSEFDLPLSVAVIAIGTGANPLIQSTTPGLKTNKRNYIEADTMTQRTSRNRGVRGR
jgi:NADPH-dependent glutamate synthase beta subunit-like oxidoreductase